MNITQLLVKRKSLNLDIQSIMLNKMNEREKDRHKMTALICGISNHDAMVLIVKTILEKIARRIILE